jgi:hypothetical protein
LLQPTHVGTLTGKHRMFGAMASEILQPNAAAEPVLGRVADGVRSERSACQS